MPQGTARAAQLKRAHEIQKICQDIDNGIARLNDYGVDVNSGLITFNQASSPTSTDGITDDDAFNLLGCIDSNIAVSSITAALNGAQSIYKQNTGQINDITAYGVRYLDNVDL